MRDSSEKKLKPSKKQPRKLTFAEDQKLAEISAWLKRKGYTAHVNLQGKVTIKVKGTEIIIEEL